MVKSRKNGMSHAWYKLYANGCPYEFFKFWLSAFERCNLQKSHDKEVLHDELADDEVSWNVEAFREEGASREEEVSNELEEPNDEEASCNGRLQAADPSVDKQWTWERKRCH